MTATSVNTSKVSRLATRLERDIRSRSLLPGDRYLTAAEAGRMLRVSTASAHRAMATLVDRQLLVRRQRSGTFIGPALRARQAIEIRNVYVLMMEHQAAQFLPSDLLIKGIRGAIRGANVQFSFLPPHDAAGFVKNLLERPIRNGEWAGVVPISCDREVYRFLAKSGLPTVVFGSLYSEKDHLSSVDVDNKEMGRLLVKCLTDRGHRRIAVLSNSHGCPGDNYFHDGVNEALTAAGLHPNAVVARYVPDIESSIEQVRELMADDDRPTGFIARSLRLADVVAQTVSGSSTNGDDLEIVFQDQTILPVESAPYRHVRPTFRFEEIAGLLGRMLDRRSRDPSSRVEHVVVPVELRGPEGRQRRHTEPLLTEVKSN